MNGQTSAATVCHGVTWATGQPTLLLAGQETGRLDHVDIIDHTIGFAVTTGARYCTGRYQFVNTYQVEPLACPRQSEATSGDQCDRCAAQDEFRGAHRIHHGGHVGAALQRYIAQPHWLYIATFAAGVAKVGTAAAPRKTSRLNEQGPIHATYLVQVPDGRTVRQLEDAISARLGLAQTVRAETKLHALVSPDRSPATHLALVERATAVLVELGLAPALSTWSTPACGNLIQHPTPGEQRGIYPHDLRSGEHGLHITSCLGTRVLAQLTSDPDATRYVADLNSLKGRKVVLGPFRSPTTAIQTHLF